jgi:two-component system sensor histidine kinase/response regulator
MNDHITKPIDPALLYQTLQHWGGHAAVPMAVSTASPARPASMHASPTTYGAAEVDALQAAVPGLEVASALRRVAGNLKLYQGLLRRYADDQAHAPERIRDRLALGDRSGADLLAHTLKGVSSNIGAQAVAAQATLLETALRGAASPEALADLLTQTTQSLAPLIAELQAWLSPGGDAAEGSVSLQPIDLDLQTELHALGRMLDDMDGDASELLEALLPRLQSCIDPQVLRDLHTKVSDFNFDDAAALLREVLA